MRCCSYNFGLIVLVMFGDLAKLDSPRRLVQFWQNFQTSLVLLIPNCTHHRMMKEEDLLKMKEIWLEELRYRKTKLGKIRIRDEKIKNNRMFREDKGMFYRKINNTKERQGTVPDIEKFVDFWAGIWEDETSTPYRRWMTTVAEKIRAKVISVEELTITEEKLYKIIRKRKNWYA